MTNTAKRLAGVAAFVMLGVAIWPSVAASEVPDAVASPTVGSLSGRVEAIVNPVEPVVDPLDPVTDPTVDPFDPDPVTDPTVDPVDPTIDPVRGEEPPPTGPTAPVALAVTTTGRDAQVTWEPPVSDGGSPIWGYRVYRQSQFVAEPNYIEYDYVVGGTGYVWKNLHAGMQYGFSVQAINSDPDLGSWTPPVSVTMPVGVPEKPTDLKASFNFLAHKADVSWAQPLFTGGLPVTGYRVNVVTPHSTFWVTTTQTKISLEGLFIPDATTITVRAKNYKGLGDPASITS